MAYRDQVAQLEHRLALAEKRAARAEASTPRRRRLFILGGALVLCLAAVGAGYALAPTRVNSVLLDGHNDAVGPVRQSAWLASRGERDCYLVADDYEPRHQAELPRRLVLRLYCDDSLIYETPQLRYGEHHVGGCISQTGRTANDHRLLCSERVVNRHGQQRGLALSADSVGHILQLISEDGQVEQWHLQARPYRRRSYPTVTPLPPAQEVTFRAQASIRELSGSPMVHGVEVPRITGRSSCEVSVRSDPHRHLDAECELRVECDGVRLYTDQGQCFHRDSTLRTFADYSATWDSHQRQGRRTPLAVLDVELGVLRLADQDRLSGFSLTLELRRPTAAVAGVF